MGAQPVLGLSLCAAAVVVAVLGPRRLARLLRLLGSTAGRLRPRRPAPPRPVGRPIEEIARDAQRLGLRFRYVPAVSFARFEACRRAYDAVLAEACHALGVDHLLGVLPPGQDLDSERDRVELVLYWAGLRLDDAA